MERLYTREKAFRGFVKLLRDAAHYNLKYKEMGPSGLQLASEYDHKMAELMLARSEAQKALDEYVMALPEPQVKAA